ncbi:MAG: enoyl-CoA hydratase/isomerase family protein [Chloroflexi bacterium]|nr:enoyl-CoA hydratase/isomerase family protein [Chloroflexota bacterium]
MATPTVLYNKEGPVAWVTLNRPHVLNAYNMAMRDELYTTLEAVRDDPEVRGVILAGAGERAFCAGADLTEFGAAPSQAIARQVRWERDVWGLFLGMDKPMVAAVHGYVLGSGVEMALLCDLRIAAEDALFGLPETALGLIPAAGGTQTLPRCIGVAEALDLLLTGRRLSAAEAFGLGLVTQVMPRRQLHEQARLTLERIIRTDPAALASAKRAVHEGLDMPLGEALALEERLAGGLLHQGKRGSRRAGRPAP